MPKGIIKLFDKDKGFGFITPDEGGRDLYVQEADLETEVMEGQRVEYEETMSRKGPAAIHVHGL